MKVEPGFAVLQAEQAVQAEAERRVSSIGNDRSRWPPPACEEVARLEKKQQVSTSFLLSDYCRLTAEQLHATR